MNKKLLLLLITICIVTFPLTVFASECVYKDRLNNEISINPSSSSFVFNGQTITYTDVFTSSCPSTLYVCNNHTLRKYSNECRSTGHSDVLTYVRGSVDSGAKTNAINCKALFGEPGDSRYVAYWLQWSLNVIKYLGIIALLIMSTADFVKALVQKDQDAIMKAASTTVKRFIYCVLLFFLPIIIEALMSLVGAYGTCNIG